MTELIEGLERIRRVLSAHTPHRINDLGAGLSPEEIEAATSDLHVILPPEIYELYQWGNGLPWNFLFENYEFLSLKLGMSCHQEELRQARSDFPEAVKFIQYRLPIFQLWSDSGVLLTVAPLEEDGSPIYGYDVEFEDYALCYCSLTDLILHSAEWYETATFVEQDDKWQIDDETAYWLDTKYMAREHIATAVLRPGDDLRQSIYQQFLDDNPTSLQSGTD